MSRVGDLTRLTPIDGNGMSLTLSAPRANALEPGLLDQIRHALDQVEARAPDFLVIQSGANFCSGGDVARFFQAAEAGKARDYATQVVPVLQEIVYRLVTLPSVVGVAARGAITGGGAGLLFAADLVVLHPGAFVQPYYAKVGFAPDGGWCALLPEKIGAGRAMSWLGADLRCSAEALRDMGLAAAVSPDPEGAQQTLLSDTGLGTLSAAKSLIWDNDRVRYLKARLDAETAAFLERIDLPSTRAGMKRFLAPQGVA